MINTRQMPRGHGNAWNWLSYYAFRPALNSPASILLLLFILLYYLFGLSFRFPSLTAIIFFGFIIIFTSGDCLRTLPCGVGQGGGGGGRAPALSQKPSYLRERLHDPDIFENTYYFLRESAFRPHETNESAHRNLHHFETAFQSVLRPPSRRIWVKTCGFNWNSTLFQTYSWS